MKSTVETLSPTRVKLSVEVPFDELKPSLDKAYRSIAQQVSIPGFRKGKVPPRLIDQRVGRAAVLEEAINDAIPQQYSAAVREHEVKVLGQPDVNVTELADNEKVSFTAEVDVRPEFTLPDYKSLAVTVDDVEVPDSEVDEQVGRLRERFAVLKGVERAVGDGDYVSLDLAATVDGEEVEGGTATGLSYEVGSGQLLDGIDEAIIGLESGGATTFTTALVGGEHAGRDAEVAVTVRSVKEKELPELDDEFAQTASEFDTLEELREDVRTRLAQVKGVEQGMQARDKVLEALLGAVEVPLPETIVTSEVEFRKHDISHQLEHAGLSLDQYLESEGKTAEEFDAELADAARNAVKSQLVLDAVADAEEVGVGNEELTSEVVRRAQDAQLQPQEFADRIVQSGQLPLLIADVRRGKALALVLEAAAIADASGRTVDLEALRRPLGVETVEVEDDAAAAAEGDAAAAAEGDAAAAAEGDAEQE
ncbi:MAG TPA: trigger factor [Mycobacteriales bacterium]